MSMLAHSKWLQKASQVIKETHTPKQQHSSKPIYFNKAYDLIAGTSIKHRRHKNTYLQ
jgi:hypothetical protein